ncbi:hypothetical protein chiPu_0015896 [Chiloscyllium punctatum]|uniref:Uncharacterized protein n=1 Tax=Chiloscyllium punctatum TaxID=137246 RepID=A0A401T438_CHIPU|nr:hypothetical protein [Chiloscyllium punctatum]
MPLTCTRYPRFDVGLMDGVQYEVTEAFSPEELADIDLVVEAVEEEAATDLPEQGVPLALLVLVLQQDHITARPPAAHPHTVSGTADIGRAQESGSVSHRVFGVQHEVIPAQDVVAQALLVAGSPAHLEQVQEEGQETETEAHTQHYRSSTSPSVPDQWGAGCPR